MTTYTHKRIEFLHKTLFLRWLNLKYLIINGIIYIPSLSNVNVNHMQRILLSLTYSTCNSLNVHHV